MSIAIRLKHSSVAAKVPQVADLSAGELALNTADLKLYCLDATNAVKEVGGAVPQATETAQGIAELATQTETDTGTDDEKIVTPLKLTTYVSQHLWIDGGSSVSNFGSAPAVITGGGA